MSFADILKKLFGSKSERDLKAVRPILDKVLAAYERIDRLTVDELREASAALKERVAAAMASDEARIAQIKEEMDKDLPVKEKEKLASEADTLEKNIDDTIEKVLNEILPDAFAIMKSTARRFAENSEIRVKASDFDRKLSSQKDFVSIDGDYALVDVTWDDGDEYISHGWFNITSEEMARDHIPDAIYESLPQADSPQLSWFAVMGREVLGAVDDVELAKWLIDTSLAEEGPIEVRFSDAAEYEDFSCRFGEIAEECAAKYGLDVALTWYGEPVQQVFTLEAS